MKATYDHSETTKLHYFQIELEEKDKHIKALEERISELEEEIKAQGEYWN